MAAQPADLGLDGSGAALLIFGDQGTTRTWGSYTAEETRAGGA